MAIGRSSIAQQIMKSPSKKKNKKSMPKLNKKMAVMAKRGKK